MGLLQLLGQLNIDLIFGKLNSFILADHQLNRNHFDDTVEHTGEHAFGKPKHTDSTEDFLSEDVAEVRTQNSDVYRVLLNVDVFGQSVWVVKQHDEDVSVLVVAAEVLSIVVDVSPGLEDQFLQFVVVFLLFFIDFGKNFRLQQEIAATIAMVSTNKFHLFINKLLFFIVRELCIDTLFDDIQKLNRIAEGIECDACDSPLMIISQLSHDDVKNKIAKDDAVVLFFSIELNKFPN